MIAAAADRVAGDARLTCVAVRRPADFFFPRRPGGRGGLRRLESSVRCRFLLGSQGSRGVSPALGSRRGVFCHAPWGGGSPAGHRAVGQWARAAGFVRRRVGCVVAVGDREGHSSAWGSGERGFVPDWSGGQGRCAVCPCAGAARQVRVVRGRREAVVGLSFSPRYPTDLFLLYYPWLISDAERRGHRFS